MLRVSFGTDTPVLVVLEVEFGTLSSLNVNVLEIKYGTVLNALSNQNA